MSLFQSGKKFFRQHGRAQSGWVTLGLAFALSLSMGCAGDAASDLVAPVVTAPDGPQASAPTAERRDSAPADAYSYNPVGRRDPMASYAAQAELGRTARQGDTKATPLMATEIDDLKLVAVVSATASPRALLEDQTGRGHIAHIGTRVGRHGGRVVKISASTVEIEEAYLDFLNRRIPVRSSLKLATNPLTASR